MFSFFENKIDNLDNFFEEDIIILDDIIYYNKSLENNYRDEFKRNLIRVKCCFLMWIIAINYFSYYISVNLNSGIEDID